ncbi:hypothetical protein SSX86_030891 [Deinandra increscens subsp. villosa]|uniref:SWIM-type domain-containing protein n=1 Tax=Deinandra increscens subsp. villosa TaxID=3103831 RepID=A0AAP0CAN5_9ASTR
MDPIESSDRTNDNRTTDSDVFVDAPSDFDINYVDSHNMIQAISSTGVPCESVGYSHEIDPDPDHDPDPEHSHEADPEYSRESAPVMEFFGVEHRGQITSNLFLTSDGTKIWTPAVPASCTPVVGMVFPNWEVVVDMYDSYADKSGFSTRLGTHRIVNGVTTFRYILCNRVGKPKLKDYNSMDPESLSTSRKTRSNISDCKACIRTKYDPETGSYTLRTFVEGHNHELVSQEFMEFSKKRRKTDFSTHQFVHQLSLNKIGPNVAHKVQSSLKGGEHNVRGTTTDYKNISRSIRMFIGDRDAQLVLDTFKARTENLRNFFFEYHVVGHELKSFFWADDVSRCSYEAFGDVLAFDATYRTNKYRMIFVPFTGVDHHKKCVTFGAGMISDETIESYTWLLESFLKAHVHQPRLVLTDQDDAMRDAISKVLYNSSHRLCMWHIMKKLPSKIEGDILNNTKLCQKLHSLVWNLIIDKDTFESRWLSLMEEHGLSNHGWLNQMYAIRFDWIPSYFRDLPMCCLMKTTSRCESSNALFKVNSSINNTLLQFLMCFDMAIDRQRHKQCQLEFETNTSTPEFHNPYPIERHAASLYTVTIFREVQKEIDRSVHYCTIGQTRSVGPSKIYTVTFNATDNTVSCECMCFTRIGYLCRHIFYVFRFVHVNEIPAQYISARWRKYALPRRVYDIANRYSVDTSEEGVLRNEVTDTVNQCINRLRRQPNLLSSFLTELKDIKSRIFSEVPFNPDINRTPAIISDILHQPEASNSSDNPVHFTPTQVRAAAAAAVAAAGVSTSSPGATVASAEQPPVRRDGPSSVPRPSIPRPVRNLRRSSRLSDKSPTA